MYLVYLFSVFTGRLNFLWKCWTTSEMNSEEQTAAIKEYEEADRSRGFDFKSAPLMRISLIRLSEDRYRMIWTWHHLLFDGWSMPVMMEEFLRTYESLKSGKQLIAKEEEDRYEDYIRYIERIDKKQEEIYWRNYLQRNRTQYIPSIYRNNYRTKQGWRDRMNQYSLTNR